MTKEKTRLNSIGNYQLTGKVLGKGNFARVEEAVHKYLGKRVAVKIIDTTAIKEEYVLRNLQREPRIMARLHHPCIAHLYETMINSSRLYMVTEAAGGGDLCALVRRAPAARLDEARARSLARQLASALRHMHARGVVHRDLKMENIMLDSSKQFIKIVDFGLSNTWTPNASLKTHCGSLEYAAPELFVVGQRYGPEVDLWSLGVIVYGMVTGRLPFAAGRAEGAGERRRTLLQHIARGFVPTHRSALAGCSDECIELIERLLQPDIHKRLNITQTCNHPWIAQQDRHMKTYPLGKISPYAKRAVYQLIGDIYNINMAEVEKEIKNDPFGPAGGILNIKSHHHILQQFSNDNILWSMAKTEPNSPINVPEYKNKILPSSEHNVGSRPNTAPSNTNIPDLGTKNSTTLSKEKSHFIPQAPRYQMRPNLKPKTNTTMSEPGGNDLFFHFNEQNCQKYTPKKEENLKTHLVASIKTSVKNIAEKQGHNNKTMEKDKMCWEKPCEKSISDNFYQRRNSSNERETAHLIGISSLKKMLNKKDQNMNNVLNSHCQFESKEQKQQTYLHRHAGDWIPSWRQHNNATPAVQRQNFFSTWGVSSHLKQSSTGNIASSHSSSSNQRSRSYTNNTSFTASQAQKTAHKLHRH